MKKMFSGAAVLLLAIFNLHFNTAHAQGTAFTYQGRLNAGGALANGSYDFRFRLAADPLGDNYNGEPYATNAIPVTNGLFTTTIDFGPTNFYGGTNWLEVDVRTNGAGGYTELYPLQPITPTPYAIYATTASNVTGTVYAAQVSGALANGNLPTSPTVSGTVTAGSFVGNGASVTNVNAAALNGLTATNFWQTGGNTVVAGQFLGSLNNQPVDFFANTNRALRLQYAVDGAYPAPNVIGGSAANSIGNNGYGDFIGGGGNAVYPNAIGANVYYSSILGGEGNTVNGSFSLAGGQNNIVSGGLAVGMGYYNQVTGTSDTALGYGNEAGNSGQAQYATAIGSANHADGSYAVAMGNYNTAGGLSTVAMGQHNTASGNYATAIGYNNTASGPASAALGTYAYAANDGDFVWADDSGGSFTSTAINQFLIRATGGVGINTNNPAGNALHVSGNVLVDNATTFNVNATVMIGGISNSVASGGAYSVIAGGAENSIQTGASASVIVGGAFNTVQPNAYDSVLVGGAANSIQTNAFYSVIDGGYNNSIQTNSSFSVLVGGVGNSIQPGSAQSFLGGGQNNSIQANAANSTVVGGYNNSASGSGSFIGGGGFDGTTIGGNTNAGNAAVIGGGVDNYIAGANFSVIGGGYLNTIQTLGGYSMIGGGYANTIQTNAYQSFIGGGGQNTVEANAYYSMICGGLSNTISSFATNATIAGGLYNTVSNGYAAIGGGKYNIAAGYESVVAGGGRTHVAELLNLPGNAAYGNYSAILGGVENTAIGEFATVAGGSGNTAGGNNSFAAGNAAYAANAGSFVWADSQNLIFSSTANNQFNVRAAGGVRFVTSGAGMTIDGTVTANGVALTSDRNAKENFQTIDPQTVLAKVAALPVTQWNYKSENQAQKHIGPMAQDFHAAFNLNADDKHISVVDEGGVALAAIKGLNEKVESGTRDTETQMAQLAAENAELRQQLADLKALVLKQAQSK